jgi:transposase-like protein
MIEAATQGEITDYLGYEKNKKSDSDNYRNGYSTKNLKSKYGEIEVILKPIKTVYNSIMGRNKLNLYTFYPYIKKDFNIE